MIDYFQHRITFVTLEGDSFHFVRGRGYGLTPLSTCIRRLRELYFLFSVCLVNEGSVVSVVLPPVVCEFLDVIAKDLMELPPH